MLFLMQSSPHYSKPKLYKKPQKPKDDDDDILLAVWMVYMRQPYKRPDE